jgi:excisionase family DNA binding protein
MTNTLRRPLLLTVKEVGRILKLERYKVYLLIEEGLLEAFRLGGCWRIKASSVERMLPLSSRADELETTFEAIDGIE